MRSVPPAGRTVARPRSAPAGKSTTPIHHNVTATSGMPPGSRELPAALSALVEFGKRADRVAPYKVTRHAGPHARCAGPSVERDARLRHVEGSDMPYASAFRGHIGCPPAPSCPSEAKLKQRVQESQSGDRAGGCSSALGGCVRAGLRSSRGSAHHSNRRRLSAPTRDFPVPLPGPKRAADEGDAASARGDLALRPSSLPSPHSEGNAHSALRL